MSSNSTKVLGIRTDIERIERFNDACNDLPLAFSSRQLIESYMDYIISMSDDYKKGKSIQIGFIQKEGGLILYDSIGKQQFISFEEDYDKKNE